MGIMDSSKKKESKVKVLSTEKFRVGWNALKLIGGGTLSIILLITLWFVFGLYVYGSFIVSTIIGSILFYSTVEVPGEMFIQCEIKFSEEEDKKVKARIISIFKIPNELLKDYKIFGDNSVRFKTRIGNTINIVDSVDHKNKIIKYSWIGEFSNFEFYLKEETFSLLKEEFKKINRDILRTKETSEIHDQIQLIKMLDDMEKDLQIDDILKELQEKLDHIFLDKNKSKDNEIKKT